MQIDACEVHIICIMDYFMRLGAGLSLHGYIKNADWASSISDRRYTNLSGFMFSLKNVVVGWCDKKQAVTSLSST